MEGLLNQLSEINTRYCEVRPTLDIAETRARELETELEAVKIELNEQKTLLNEQEERNKQMYLKMYAKGQEAARLEQADQVILWKVRKKTEEKSALLNNFHKISDIHASPSIAA